MKTVEELLKDPANWAEGFTTREGRAVRIIAHEPSFASYETVGIIEGNHAFDRWRNGGRYLSGCECSSDLIPRPVKRKGWVNVYPDMLRMCKEDADYHRSHDAIACIEVEFCEGDGL